VGAAFAALRDVLAPQTSVAFASAISRADESVRLTTLGEADPALADMRTLVLVGTEATRRIARPDGSAWLYTPRQA
jgi:precorrin-3B C17-methyltransferase